MKNLFKESWFIFDTSSSKEEKSKVVSASEEAALNPAEKLNAEVQGLKLETTKKSSKTRETFNTQVKLDTLKSKINAATINEILSKVSFKYEFNKDSYNNPAELTDKIERSINISPQQELALEELIKDSPYKLEESFSNTIKKIMVASVNSSVFAKLHKEYPEIASFDLFKQGLAKVDMDINFDTAGDSQINLTCNKQTEFDEFKKDSEVDKKEIVDNESITQKKEAIKKAVSEHEWGWVLSAFVSDESIDGKDSPLTELAKGNSLSSNVISFLLGFFGVNYFSENYDKAIATLEKHPKSQGIAASIKGLRPKISSKSEEGAETVSENLEKVDDRKFDQIVRKVIRPTKDFELTKNYNVASELKVDLVPSKTIKIPKGTTMIVDGKEISATTDEGKTITGGIHVITGTITKGAVFDQSILFKTT